MNAPALTWEQEEILDLRDRIDELEQENLHLRSLLSGAESGGCVDRLSAGLGLTKAEAAVLWSLLSSTNGYRSKEALLHAACRRGDVDASSNLVSVIIYSLRKKIARKGISIGTVWGDGYRIDERSRSKLKSMIKKASSND